MKYVFYLLLAACLLPVSLAAQKLTKEQKAHQAAIQKSATERITLVSQDTVYSLGKAIATLRPLSTHGYGEQPDLKLQDLSGTTLGTIKLEKSTLNVITFTHPASGNAYLYGTFEKDDRATYIATRLTEADVLTERGTSAQAQQALIAANPEKEHALVGIGRDLKTFGTKVADETRTVVEDARNPIVERDRSQAISIRPGEIVQGGVVIGKYESSSFNNAGQVTTQVSVYYTNGDKCAAVRYDQAGKASIYPAKDGQQYDRMLPVSQEMMAVAQFLVQGGYL